MIKGILKALGLDPNDRALKKYRARVEKINALEPTVKEMTTEAITERALEIRGQIAQGASLDDYLVEVFALTREMALRTLGLRPFDVQLIGAMALHDANIAEMKTGEGKTLVAPLCVVLNAFTGKGVHVVTVNDYLARRDAKWMEPLYQGMGCTVGVIYAFMDPAERKNAYECDITYGTNSEFGFDYLRDNMATNEADLVQRGHNFCIVDEVDSILIDEARTPLIISGPSQDDPKAYERADQVARTLEGIIKDPNEFHSSRNLFEKEEVKEPDADFEVDEKEKSVSLTSRGQAKCEKALGIAGLFSDVSHADMAHKIQQAIKAHNLFKKDVDYVVKDGQIVIVDEFTGRLMFGRRYSDGLHQAIEAKERVKIGRESQTLATITLQNYFRLYTKLAGMTGTAATEAEEFKEIYGLGVVVIPTNRPVARKDEPDMVYNTKREKYDAAVAEIAKVHATGRPILVGTASVDTSELLSRMLKAQHIPHQVLNARHHEQESAIVAQAGRLGAVTVATNMAGRGTDIVLGGNPDFLAREALVEEGLDPVKDHERLSQLKEEFATQCAEEKKKVLDLGGLYILGTERHEARRIDNQLRGRSGRQGDPGTSRFFLSLEDDLLRLFGADKLQNFFTKVVKMAEGEALESSMLTSVLESSQKKVEEVHYDIRRQLLMYDNVMNHQREAVYNERNLILHTDGLIDHAQELIVSVVGDILDTYYPENEVSDAAGAAVRLKSVFWPGIERHLVGVDDRHHLEQARRAIESEVLDRFNERVETLSAPVASGIFKFIALHVLDSAWKEHLLGMEALREGIGLRAVGQKDPLMEYQFESYNLFKSTMESVRENIAQMFFRVAVVSEEDKARQVNVHRIAPAQQPRAVEPQPKKLPSQNGPLWGGMSRGGYFGNGGAKPAPAQKGDKVGRNDDCPCGSGKKYKNCCGK